MTSSIMAQLQQEHTITVLVENHPGVLARVAGLFARRGFNIESLAVSVTDKPEVSRMTIVVGGDLRVLEQITKQLNKLVEVLKVVDYSETAAVERELALIKVNAESKDRAEIMQIVEIFRGRIIDMSDKTFIIEVTGSTDKLDKITDLLTAYGIRELVRTGIIAMARGAKTASRTGREVTGGLECFSSMRYSGSHTGMGDLHELVDLGMIGRLFSIAAIAGPAAGLLIGGITGSRNKNVKRGMLFGLLWGLLGVLNWLLWRTYNAITDRNGLDTVKNLVLNLALFVLVGVVIGICAARISRSKPP